MRKARKWSVAVARDYVCPIQYLCHNTTYIHDDIMVSLENSRKLWKSCGNMIFLFLAKLNKVQIKKVLEF